MINNCKFKLFKKCNLSDNSNLLIEKQNNEINLRPRFTIAVEESSEKLIEKITDCLKSANCVYKNRIVDGHFFIDISEAKSSFWSPQLNFEIIKLDEKSSIIKGLFGPKPEVWTLFMFVHFIVATMFFGFVMMTFVRYQLNESLLFPISMLLALPLIWLLLYFLGKIGRESSKEQIKELHNFLIAMI